MQHAFAEKVKSIIEKDEQVMGLAVAGSWLTNEIDEFSDLDLILITKEKIASGKNKMLAYANSFGKLLSGFTGEHVGEPRLLICLYDDPLIHVDIKFLTVDELDKRVEDPIVLFDRDGSVQQALQRSKAAFPQPDYQWIEDRFWTWVHYALLKIGRGEYMEAIDFFGFLRMIVLGPLLHIKNGNLPRGVRKVESQLEKNDLAQLLSTLPANNKIGLLTALENAVFLYRDLRIALFDESINLHMEAEQKVMEYFQRIKNS